MNQDTDNGVSKEQTEEIDFDLSENLLNEHAKSIIADATDATSKTSYTQDDLRERNLIPAISWSRRLSHVFPPVRDFQVGWKEGAKLAMLGWRMWKYIRRERSAGRIPIMDPFSTPIVEPLMGVPIGGIGGGSIGRGWRGDFIRWNIAPCGISSSSTVEVDQFSVFIKRKTPGSFGTASVLYPGKPKKNKALAYTWDWNVKGDSCMYYGLFPRAWTVYQEPDPHIRLICRQVAPVIPHNYKESSYPCGVFVWTIDNTGDSDAEVSLMFTFQNGMGSPVDLNGGHINFPFTRKVGENNIVGVTLKHKMQQTSMVDGKNVTFEDPLSFAVGAIDKNDPNQKLQITYCTKFNTNAQPSLEKLWQQFQKNGCVSDVEDWKSASQKGKSIGAAVAVKVTVPANRQKEIVFGIAWDSPIARFSSGASYYRRYTSFYGKNANVVQDILCDALINYPAWEKEIDAWQQQILKDSNLPDYYKAALFNELYYIVDGGTIWTTNSTTRLEAEKNDGQLLEVDLNATTSDPIIPPDDDIGHFAYLESLEYLMYNTYDVHFYASFALAMLWPKLELSLQRDIALATMKQYPEQWETMHSGKMAFRKVKGAVPHDVGNPGEDPWNKVNSYCIQDIARWKDLPCKFVLQIYRDYVITKDLKFLTDVWPVVKETIQYARQFDLDGDGVLDNENFPDQTYDTWSAEGCSAYTGGLWLACLSAAANIAVLMNDKETAREYTRILEQGKQSYQEKLWNGKYYNYDSSKSLHHDSIMADQMAGQWYAKACGLKSIVPEGHAFLALKTVYEMNVMSFKNGTLGAINGMRSDGKLDDTCMQSLEVWTGTTYAAAAAMLQQGLVKEAFETAKGIILSTYQDLGYMYQTPEAWDTKGQYRSAAYMRPLVIWAIQWAWEQFYTKKGEHFVEQQLVSTGLTELLHVSLTDSQATQREINKTTEEEKHDKEIVSNQEEF